jgi:hypothetical protein
MATIDAQVQEQKALLRKREAIEGRTLSSILNISEETVQSVLRGFGLTVPAIAVVLNRVDCSACYDVHNQRIHAIVQQYHVPVIAITYIHADYIQRDFRNKLILFPLPLTQRFLEQFSDNMAIFCMMPNGFVLYADIPNPEHPEQSAEFYRRTVALLQLYATSTSSQ